MRITLLLASCAAVFATAASAGEYELVIAEQTVNITGKPMKKITVNGTIPGPVLRFKEGEQVTVRVTNKLKENSSVHWHGLILPPEEDGVPGFNGFPGIRPGETYTYRFPVQQNGTYWYHAHSATQEQSGHYGPLIIDPATPSPVAFNREYTVLLSEFTPEDPEEIINNLKGDPGFYNFSKRTVPDFFRDARKFGLRAAWRDRRAWGRMRMDPTDISDVANYTFLVNGKPPAKNETFVFRPGERIKLRFINAAAMTFFDVRIPGAKMTVVAADGRDVDPVSVDEFRIAVSETYDVIVQPETEQPLTVFAESIDRTGYARATLAKQEGVSGPLPKMRPRALLTMAEMGHNMSQMSGMAGMQDSGTPGVALAASGPGGTLAQPAAGARSGSPQGMDHANMPGMSGSAQAAPASGVMQGMDHSGMSGMSRSPQAAPAPGGSTPAMDHSNMPGMSRPAQGLPASGAMQGMDHANMPGMARTPYPKVDYGMGQAMKMDGMDHGGMALNGGDIAGRDDAGMNMAGMGDGAMPGMNMDGLGAEGELDGSGRVFGWASGAPWGSRVLSYADLRAATPQKDTRAPEREIIVRLSGNMERYIWTLNGKKFGEAEPIRLRHVERVRLTFVNETMMAHPMHLHGVFQQIENGQPVDRLPDKSVIGVAPGKTYSVLITAEYEGEWAFHCHLLYHMEAGMMQKVVVARADESPAAPNTSVQDGRATHGAH